MEYNKTLQETREREENGNTMCPASMMSERCDSVKKTTDTTSTAQLDKLCCPCLDPSSSEVVFANRLLCLHRSLHVVDGRCLLQLPVRLAVALDCLVQPLRSDNLLNNLNLCPRAGPDALCQENAAAPSNVSKLAGVFLFSCSHSVATTVPALCRLAAPTHGRNKVLTYLLGTLEGRALTPS